MHLSPAPRNPERQLEIRRSATFVVSMSPSGRFCCRNPHTDGAGTAGAFFETIDCHSLDCGGDLRSTLLTLATLKQRAKGRTVVAGLFAEAFNRLLQQNRHRTDMPTLLSDVRCWVNSGKHLLAASISEFDPSATSAPKFAVVHNAASPRRVW
jgi:hypothetical protein